ncbi:hypothetical protein TorRG33x02_166820 [Trema orientale]|uniref:Uncharacterized protein n=1 Tax=Trema orientale TaxID=63057 RepID=A0A2P5EPN7_TREOI|nr:hypothetical protein TorRG33x02_166820 [Trema orientale]
MSATSTSQRLDSKRSFFIYLSTRKIESGGGT